MAEYRQQHNDILAEEKSTLAAMKKESVQSLQSLFDEIEVTTTFISRYHRGGIILRFVTCYLTPRNVCSHWNT